MKFKRFKSARQRKFVMMKFAIASIKTKKHYGDFQTENEALKFQEKIIEPTFIMKYPKDLQYKVSKHYIFLTRSSKHFY